MVVSFKSCQSIFYSFNSLHTLCPKLCCFTISLFPIFTCPQTCDRLFPNHRMQPIFSFTTLYQRPISQRFNHPPLLSFWHIPQQTQQSLSRDSRHILIAIASQTAE